MLPACLASALRSLPSHLTFLLVLAIYLASTLLPRRSQTTTGDSRTFQVLQFWRKTGIFSDQISKLPLEWGAPASGLISPAPWENCLRKGSKIPPNLTAHASESVLRYCACEEGQQKKFLEPRGSEVGSNFIYLFFLSEIPNFSPYLASMHPIALGAASLLANIRNSFSRILPHCYPPSKKKKQKPLISPVLCSGDDRMEECSTWLETQPKHRGVPGADAGCRIQGHTGGGSQDSWPWQSSLSS